MNYLPCIEIESQPQLAVSASIILMHGLGAAGSDFVPLIAELNLPTDRSIRFIFPQAPDLPITVNGGYVMPAWYDIYELSLERKLDESKLRESAGQVQQLIAREIARGVPSERIILAGFSQGGAVAYEAALSFASPLGGLLAMSTYFATYGSIALHEANHKLPILIQHGALDGVVAPALAVQAREFLASKHYAVESESYPMEHTLCVPQIAAIARWIARVLA